MLYMLQKPVAQIKPLDYNCRTFVVDDANLICTFHVVGVLEQAIQMEVKLLHFLHLTILGEPELFAGAHLIHVHEYGRHLSRKQVVLKKYPLVHLKCDVGTAGKWSFF